MDKVILDTDIFSEIQKRINPRILIKGTTYLAIHKQYTISVITVTEVVKGWHKLGREDRIQTFLTNINHAEILILNQKIAELSGRIYADLESQGQTIGLADVTIAATAIHHNLTLITGNFNHYQRIVNSGYVLKLDNWRT